MARLARLRPSPQLCADVEKVVFFLARVSSPSLPTGETEASDRGASVPVTMRDDTLASQPQSVVMPATASELVKHAPVSSGVFFVAPANKRPPEWWRSDTVRRRNKALQWGFGVRITAILDADADAARFYSHGSVWRAHAGRQSQRCA
jgi:hypothetical protein